MTLKLFVVVAVNVLTFPVVLAFPIVPRVLAFPMLEPNSRTALS
jgi:hypothetical protein